MRQRGRTRALARCRQPCAKCRIAKQGTPELLEIMGESVPRIAKQGTPELLEIMGESVPRIAKPGTPELLEIMGELVSQICSLGHRTAHQVHPVVLLPDGVEGIAADGAAAGLRQGNGAPHRSDYRWCAELNSQLRRRARQAARDGGQQHDHHVSRHMIIAPHAARRPRGAHQCRARAELFRMHTKFKFSRNRSSVPTKLFSRYL
eukprot:SAG31_NODE_418_length_15893_cov_5.433899_4_plen_205_part_00